MRPVSQFRSEPSQIIDNLKMLRHLLAVAATLALLSGYCVFGEPLSKDLITCTACTTVVEIIDSKLLANATLEEIESSVIGVCDILTGLEQECRDFVHVQLPFVINLLVEEYLDPRKVCEYISLCP